MDAQPLNADPSVPAHLPGLFQVGVLLAAMPTGYLAQRSGSTLLRPVTATVSTADRTTPQTVAEHCRGVISR
jgi:hypothetical protein